MYKKIAAFALILTVILSITAIAAVEGTISVGVKKGDWIEYTVSTTGAPPAAHDITWAKMEILNVEGVVLQANITTRSVNGTVSSAVRSFNFTEGQVQAWIIIPADLGPGDMFYDSSIPGNVTIQGQEQKMVAGATRTITHASDSVKYKEWDKATGVFTLTRDNVGTYTVNATAIATNMWSPQILGLDQTVFYLIIIAIIVVAVAVIVLSVVLVRKNRSLKNRSLQL